MLTLAKYVIENGPIVATRDVAKIYKELKELKPSYRIESSKLLEIMGKHLNVAQIYIDGLAYILENPGDEVLRSLNAIHKISAVKQSTTNEKVREVIGNDFGIILQYLDSKRDRDTLNAILTKITSVNFMSKLANVQDKRVFQRSQDQVSLNLQLFEEMKRNIEQTADPILTGEPARRKKYRMLQKLRHVFKGTHIFMETESQVKDERGQHVSITRTGAAATLVNISHFEPETVQRVFNEIFVLMVNPALDKHFQNPYTGRLKEHFVFIVDNGPSEAPSNSLVQMWLVRLARVLKLKSMTQKSFVEYHSKRNPVERVHAVENRALSNEVFSSTAVHKDYVIGDQHHRENMEHMAGEVQNCLARTQFGKQPIVVQRGIGTEENFVFNDESPLVTFLGKCECRKNLDNTCYYPVKNNLWKEVTTLWDLDESYIGCYREDYQILQNRLEEEGGRTCWADKYSTTIINPVIQQEDITFQQQPVPDYVRWFNTEGELHYMPLGKVQKLVTEMIDGTPGAFLPSKVLEMTYKVFAHGIDTVLPYIAFLSWCTEDEVKQFYAEFKDRLDTKFQNDKEREYWCQHELYKNEDIIKTSLKLKCRANKISGDGKKHELVKA